jgi:transcriptional regulator NrdR family protein
MFDSVAHLSIEFKRTAVCIFSNDICSKHKMSYEKGKIMNVIKKDGAVVPFDISKISVAIAKAWLDQIGRTDLSSAERNQIDSIAQAVLRHGRRAESRKGVYRFPCN